MFIIRVVLLVSRCRQRFVNLHHLLGGHVPDVEPELHDARAAGNSGRKKNSKKF